MRYLGGKSKIADSLARVIVSYSVNRSLLIEPFCGGCGATVALAPYFKQVRSYDTHKDLILMWEAVKQGWLPPENLTEKEYDRLRDEEPSALRGFAGFGCSWGGKWFGGYAKGGNRNHVLESSTNVKDQAQYLGNVEFFRKSYENIRIPEGSTIYADPPYADTTGYSQDFDSDKFWSIAENWALTHNALVFVSEFTAPAKWECVWELKRALTVRGSKRPTSIKKIEHLYMYNPNSGPNKIGRKIPKIL